MQCYLQNFQRISTVAAFFADPTKNKKFCSSRIFFSQVEDEEGGTFFFFSSSSFSYRAAPLLGPLTCGQKCLRSEVGQPRVGWANSPNTSRLFYQLALKGYFEACTAAICKRQYFYNEKRIFCASFN